MKFYYTDSYYFRGKGEAEKAARLAAKESYEAIDVQVVDVSTDKENMLRLLNNHGGHTRFGETIYSAPGKKRSI